MRYYEIIIQKNTPAGNAEAGQPLKYYSTLNANRSNNPSALRVCFDILSADFNQMGADFGIVQVYGVSYADIASTADYNGQLITVYAGMSKGLPLANQSQNGIIYKGVIFACFGNWQGTEVCLQFTMQSLINTNEVPANIILNWEKGKQLTDAVKRSLNAAYPTYSVVGEYNPAIVAPQDTVAFFPTLASFSEAIKKVSKLANVSDTYAGAAIALEQKQFLLFDGTKTYQEAVSKNNTVKQDTKYKQILFNDLIGNATWQQTNIMQFKCVMRADLKIGMEIIMPKGTNILNPGANVRPEVTFKNTINFPGIFQISQIRHLGDSRQASADSWVTIVDCTFIKLANA